MNMVHIRGKTRALLKTKAKQHQAFVKGLTPALADGGTYGKHCRILLYLANNGPATKYRIEKEIKPPIDRPTIYKIISDLKATACIRVVKAGVSRAGKRMEFYDLRLTGVIIAIIHDTLPVIKGNAEQYELDMDMIVKKYHSPKSYFSVIFEYWNFFKENGWNPEEEFRHSCLMAFRWQDWFDRILKGEEPDPRTLSDFPYYSSWPAGPNRFPEFHGLLLPLELVVTIEPNRFFSRGFVRELSYLSESKPKSKPFREQLKKWEDRLEDTIAFHLFRIWINEDTWQDQKRQEALSHADDEFLNLARIWIKNKDLSEYLTNRVAGLMEWNGEVASKYSKYASEYLERSAWFKARKEKIENMKVEPLTGTRQAKKPNA